MNYSLYLSAAYDLVNTMAGNGEDGIGDKWQEK